MRLRYLDTAAPGLRWMRRYYRTHPQLDAGRAVEALLKAEAILIEHPHAGTRFEDIDRVREIIVGGTVFSMLYTVADETIWVIDVRDQRGPRSAEALRRYVAELRRANGLASEE